MSLFFQPGKSDRIRRYVSMAFYLAHELRELGSYDAMIETYEKLVREFPKSDLVLDAYLVLGDYQFDQGDLPGAENWYQKILAAPPSPTHDIAHYKMGWVELNEAKFEAAFQHFEAAVKTAWAAPGKEGDDARRLDVKREAMVDLAYTFTEVKKSESALAYFRRLAPSRSVYVLTLEKLAGRYFVQENYPAASRIYRELARLAHDPAENLDRTSQVYRASLRSRRYPRVDQDVDGMLDAVDAYRFDWRVGADERQSAGTDVELQARDLATKAQQAALKAKDRTLGAKVAAAYDRYLQSFPESPKRAEILQNLADTLYEARRFLEAGDRYEEAALALRSEKAIRQALFNACAAFRQAIEVGGPTMPRFDRLWAQRGLIQNGRTYVERFPDSP
ncbi:MAG: tetratricopeptide repeat protein, partial [Myxococcota bacterium]